MIYLKIISKMLFSAIVRFSRQVKIQKFALDSGARVGCGASYTGNLSNLTIGSGTVINPGVNMRFKNGCIRIGSMCFVGRNCSIVANKYVLDEKTISVKKMVGMDVTIGDNVLIGNNVVILPGVVVGDGAVIGANCVVTKNIRSFEVHGGVPNKLIYTRNLT